MQDMGHGWYIWHLMFNLQVLRTVEVSLQNIHIGQKASIVSTLNVLWGKHLLHYTSYHLLWITIEFLWSLHGLKVVALTTYKFLLCCIIKVVQKNWWPPHFIILTDKFLPTFNPHRKLGKRRRSHSTLKCWKPKCFYFVEYIIDEATLSLLSTASFRAAMNHF